MSDRPFLELLPASLSMDRTMHGVADSLEPHLCAGDAAIASILLIARLSGDGKPLAPALERLVEQSGGLKELEENLLDLMAWQYHVDDYDLAQSYDAKLDMVRTSIALHRKKGTRWAVRRAIDAAFQDISTTVLEWFEYGAEPYHFKVAISVFGDGIMKDAIERAHRLIESNKSKRSICDGITLALASSVTTHCGTAVCMGTCITIEPELIDALDAQPLNSFCGLGTHIESSMTICS